MPAAVALSQTISMRVASGEEVLVVRVLTREGIAGYGFTFCENVAAARSMACWDATARAAHRPLWQLLREAAPDVRDQLRVGLDDHAHSWSRTWRATLEAAGETAGTLAPDAPGSGIDWTSEPGFMTLRWIEPETKQEEPHGRTVD